MPRPPQTAGAAWLAPEHDCIPPIGESRSRTTLSNDLCGIGCCLLIEVDQQARCVLRGADLPGRRGCDGRVSCSIEEPAIREPVQQLLRRRLLAQGEQHRQHLTQKRERVDPQVVARAHHRIQHRRRLPARFAPNDASVVSLKLDRHIDRDQADGRSDRSVALSEGVGTSHQSPA